MIENAGEARLQDLRNGYYPAWWTHQTVARVSDMPAYRVVCASEAERQLALSCKPPFIEAEVIVRAQPAASLPRARNS